MGIDVFLLGIVAASLVLIFLGYAISFALGATALVFLLVNDFPLTVAAQELGLSVRRRWCFSH